LAAAGHDVAIYQYNGHFGPPSRWGDVLLYGRGVIFNGQDLLGTIAKQWGAEVILSICDPWIIRPSVWAELTAPVVMWCPIQAAPLHADYAAVLDKAAAVWVYSEFGRRTLERAGYTAEHVPLGYDPRHFGAHDRAEARAWFDVLAGKDISDKILIGVVAANASTVPGPRKGHDAALQIMATLESRYPGRYHMYMHSRMGNELGGIDLSAPIADLGIGDAVGFPDELNIHQGLPVDWMARMMTALDVLLAPSMAEGFGMPILEAQACGTPVVTVKASSMTELVYLGEAVSPAGHQWADLAPGGWVAVPDTDALANAISPEHIASMHAGRDHIQGESYQQAQLDAFLSRHQWDTIAARVIALLADMPVAEAVTCG
jgi:glycosyltransferase involved in cell wall biosynthesis